MDKIRFYIRESYEELIHKVSWPTWRDLIENTRIVIIATIIFALIIFLMDVVSNSAMNFIYGLN
ncbi:MAG TPA: preprotein translocase subunit SecE [Saprospiraceae bacterium]|nr:preprotein translocase subunit SecE [Saprospiraceae bacterium]